MEDNDFMEGMEENTLTETQSEAIEKKIAELKKANPGVRKIFAIAVKGEEDCDDKELYVGYFKRPGTATFSKYIAAAGNNNVVPAAKMLAKETWIDGDKELLDDEDLFIFGLFPRLNQLTQTRVTAFVNLSKPRK